MKRRIGRITQRKSRRVLKVEDPWGTASWRETEGESMVLKIIVFEEIIHCTVVSKFNCYSCTNEFTSSIQPSL